MPVIISRDEAAARGVARYFTGELCRKGHLSHRYVCSRICCECAKENHKLWYERHPEIAAEKRAQDKRKNPDRYRLYYRRNAEKRKAQAKAWYEANKERASEVCRAWVERNPDKVRAIGRISRRSRRAREFEAGGSHTEADLARIFRQQGGKCAACKCSLSNACKEVDHIVPLALGGHNNASNLQYLCRPCNRAKSAKDPLQFAQERGLLL